MSLIQGVESTESKAPMRPGEDGNAALQTYFLGDPVVRVLTSPSPEGHTHASAPVDDRLPVPMLGRDLGVGRGSLFGQNDDLGFDFLEAGFRRSMPAYPGKLVSATDIWERVGRGGTEDDETPRGLW